MKKNILLFGTLLTISTLSLSTLNTVHADSKQKTHSFVVKKSKKKKSTKKEKVIYKDDTRINKFLNAYNKVNPSDVISSDMFDSYYHHGSNHKDQIIFKNKNNCEIVISGGHKIKVVITRNSTTSEDEFKNEFIKFARAFDSKLSGETLSLFWDGMSQYGANEVFDRFEFSHRDSYVVMDSAYAKVR